ncbi:MAG: hypothetical protein Fur0037_19710 [Planctomycetota bacterium]
MPRMTARRATVFLLREIRPEDDPVVAGIIRSVMTEFGCTAQGFAIHDAEVDRMSAAYDSPDSAYYVATSRGRPARLPARREETARLPAVLPREDILDGGRAPALREVGLPPAAGPHGRERPSRVRPPLREETLRPGSFAL